MLSHSNSFQLSPSSGSDEVKDLFFTTKPAHSLLRLPATRALAASLDCPLDLPLNRRLLPKGIRLACLLSFFLDCCLLCYSEGPVNEISVARTFSVKAAIESETSGLAARHVLCRLGSCSLSLPSHFVGSHWAPSVKIRWGRTYHLPTQARHFPRGHIQRSTHPCRIHLHFPRITATLYPQPCIFSYINKPCAVCRRRLHSP